MDHDCFDDLTRSVGSGGETRRAVVRLLAGGALGGLVARLGLAAGTEAKPKKHKAKPKQKRKSRQSGRRRDSSRPRASARGTSTTSSPRPRCHRPCHHVGRARSRARTSRVCLPTSAAQASSSVPDDGPCLKLNAGMCCPGEKLCPDSETPSGLGCIDENNCCPDLHPVCRECYHSDCENGNWGGCKRISGCCPTGMRKCPDDSCVVAGECCPAEKKCADDVCYPKDDCCPEDIPRSAPSAMSRSAATTGLGRASPYRAAAPRIMWTVPASYNGQDIMVGAAQQGIIPRSTVVPSALTLWALACIATL